MSTLIVLVLVTACVTNLVSGIQTGNFLNFDTESIDMSDDSVSQSVKVWLKEKPSDDVNVYYEATNTRFDQCALNFSPSNWDKPQSLKVVAVPYANKEKTPRNVPIKFTAYAEDCDSNCHGLEQELPTVRTSEPCGQCRVMGDPHYKTFDQNRIMNYQGIGDFYLVKSDVMVVQARQGKCWKASCVHALAIRYGTASFVIDSNDPDPNVCVKTISNLEGVIISRSRTGKMTTVNVAFNAGSSLRVDIVGSGRNHFMNVYIDLANHLKGKVNGLCGKYDGNASNDFTSPNGDSFDANDILGQSAADKFGSSSTYQQSSLFKYGETWRVKDVDNMFKCKNKCSVFGYSVRPAIDFLVTECKIPDQPKCSKNAPPVYTTVSSTIAGYSASFVYSPPSRQTLSGELTTATRPYVPYTFTTESTSAPTQYSNYQNTKDNRSGTYSPVYTGPLARHSRSTGETYTYANFLTTRIAPLYPQATYPQATYPQWAPPPSPPKYENCPRPIYVIPVPPGYSREKDIPRYIEEPLQPEYVNIPNPSKDEADKNRKWCSLKITPIDQCDEDISQYISSCEADIDGQINPETACNMHRDAYAAVCSQCVLDKTKNNQPDIYDPAREAAKNHCFGNIQCDDNCRQCGDRGCLECKDLNAYEVLAGRCVPKQKMEYNAQFYAPAPAYRVLSESEIAAKGIDPSIVGNNSNVNFYLNPQAEVQTESIANAVSESPVEDASSTRPDTTKNPGLQSSANHVNLSFMSILSVLLVGLVI